MTAGLLQLNFIGPQDKYLTGNPQMTYFKSVFKSHSNFAKDTQKLQFENAVQLGSTHTCVISRIGDLLSDLYLYVELPELVSSDNNENWAGYTNGVGLSIIKSVSLQIGGQTIDTLDSNWLDAPPITVSLSVRTSSENVSIVVFSSPTTLSCAISSLVI